MRKYFNTTGLCYPEEHYMVNIENRLEEIKNLVDRGEYFVINRARQYGKTTTIHLLAEKPYFPLASREWRTKHTKAPPDFVKDSAVSYTGIYRIIRYPGFQSLFGVNLSECKMRRWIWKICQILSQSYVSSQKSRWY